MQLAIGNRTYPQKFKNNYPLLWNSLVFAKKKIVYFLYELYSSCVYLTNPTKSDVFVYNFVRLGHHAYGCQQWGAGESFSPPWIFIHGTDKVEKCLMVLFFRLVFFPLPPPLEFFLPSPLTMPGRLLSLNIEIGIKCFSQGYSHDLTQ